METSELKPIEFRKIVSSGLWRREEVLGENAGSATWSSSPLNAGWSDGPLLLSLPGPRPKDGEEHCAESLPRKAMFRGPSMSFVVLCLRMGVSVRYLSEAKKPKREEEEEEGVAADVGVCDILALAASPLSRSRATFLSPLCALAWNRRERVLVTIFAPSPLSPGEGEGEGAGTGAGLVDPGMFPLSLKLLSSI